jgi:hypothetical protein
MPKYMETECANLCDDMAADIKSLIDDSVYGRLIDLWDTAFDYGYEEGIAVGIRMEKVTAMGLDPWSKEGEAKMAELEKAEIKAARAKAKAEKKAESTESCNVSSKSKGAE